MAKTLKELGLKTRPILQEVDGKLVEHRGIVVTRDNVDNVALWCGGVYLFTKRIGKTPINHRIQLTNKKEKRAYPGDVVVKRPDGTFYVIKYDEWAKYVPLG